jgi:hypothetical protein
MWFDYDLIVEYQYITVFTSQILSFSYPELRLK